MRILRVAPVLTCLVIPIRELVLYPSSPWGYAGAIIPIIIAVVLYNRVPPVLFSTDESGICISACKEGLYDPDYIEYSRIENAAVSEKSGIEFALNDGDRVKIHIPKRHRQAVIDHVLSVKQGA